MRKLFTGALVLAGLFFLWTSFVIPAQISISRTVTVRANYNSVVRSLKEKEKWQNWWPAAHSGLLYSKSNFSGWHSMNSTVAVNVTLEDSIIQSVLTILPLSQDSTTVNWLCTLPASTSPLSRLSMFWEARRIKKEMNGILASLQKYVENSANIYGMHIRQIKVTEPVLVSAKDSTLGYPSTPSIYAVIRELQEYIQEKGARPTSYPMLHINQLDSSRYEFMVGIPTDRSLPPAGRIKPKRFVLGNILVAEVRGGAYTAQQGMNELQNYVLDNQLVSPALPYQSLVTDRMKEPDTNRWITRLYYPVY